MPVSVEVFHARPHSEIYFRVREMILQSDGVSVAVGFLTEAGISLITSALRGHLKYSFRAGDWRGQKGLLRLVRIPTLPFSTATFQAESLKNDR